jgi:formylglycine-generating enzyme required for sulfatase activity/nitrate/TMAO reductase-like tetraheme cytochrome c subunit
MVRRVSGRNWLFILTGVIVASLLIFAGNKAVIYTSTDDFCNRCHVHPHSNQSWIRSTHYDNQRGIIVHCVECHLPPHGEGYLTEKIKTGTRDVYGAIFKDISKINWEEKSRPEIAARHTYLSACIECHDNLFTTGLSKEGEDAHLYYNQHEGDVHCINCHLQVGHYSENVIHAKNVEFGKQQEVDTIYAEAAVIDEFESYTEYLPGTGVSFDMVAIPGGNFMMGSPQEESFRKEDEGPLVEVSLKPFFIAKTEVSWDEYLAFFSAMRTDGRAGDAYLNSLNATDIDAITGPTPPWGAPDQGWGTGSYPAITMTYHAARIYCLWLSKVTGKKYRLPTEAEWEYAARGGTTGPYFFEGDPADFEKNKYKNKLAESDTSGIVTYVNYNLTSMGRTVPSELLRENPFGLVNMLGNVAEFCQDWYDPGTYSSYPAGIIDNPTGPSTGTEHVVRGGSFRSETGDVRCASRGRTWHDAWLKTDPQIPKSIWWYSDCVHVGFRVVCEYD